MNDFMKGDTIKGTKRSFLPDYDFSITYIGFYSPDTEEELHFYYKNKIIYKTDTYFYALAREKTIEFKSNRMVLIEKKIKIKNIITGENSYWI